VGLRKAIAFVLLALAVVAVLPSARASAYDGPPPYTTDDGTLMVPIRAVAEANGAQILLGVDDSVVVIARKVEPPTYDEFFIPIRPGREETRVTVFYPGERRVLVQGVEVLMPVPAEIRGGRLFVPWQFARLATFIE